VSFLLTSSEFTAARHGVRDGEMTPQLYAWLGRLVAIAQATRALAPSPVPGGRWDDRDALAEALHAWLEESLLRGGLQQAFDRCDSPRALSRYLERALRNWLVARSRRAIGPRLLERTGELLGDPNQGFRLVADARLPADRWWGLAEWSATPELFVGEDDTVIAAAWALGDFALLRYPSSERSDPVLSTPDLHRFISGLLQTLGVALSGRHFSVALRGRFPYAYAQPNVALDDLTEPTGGESAEHAFEVAEAARLAIITLTGRQLQVLLARPQATLEELATRLGVSRGTVDNEYRRALLKVRESTISDDQFDMVLEKVLEMASEKRHNDE
jgi:DNA-binding CsgD family transcriptional regulator